MNGKSKHRNKNSSSLAIAFVVSQLIYHNSVMHLMYVVFICNAQFILMEMY